MKISTKLANVHMDLQRTIAHREHALNTLLAQSVDCEFTIERMDRISGLCSELSESKQLLELLIEWLEQMTTEEALHRKILTATSTALHVENWPLRSLLQLLIDEMHTELTS